MANNSTTEDYLEVDKSIPGQNYACISFVSPEKVLKQKEMFMFENFDNEIRSYFMNNYFFDDPSADEALDMTLKIHCIIESINQKGGEKIVSAHILFSNQADQHHSSKSFDFRYVNQVAINKYSDAISKFKFSVFIIYSLN